LLQVAARRTGLTSDGLKDEEQVAEEGSRGKLRQDVGEQPAGAWCRGRLADDSDTEAGSVKASVIACSGRCQ
jgi:hypothetical protein